MKSQNLILYAAFIMVTFILFSSTSYGVCETLEASGDLVAPKYPDAVYDDNQKKNNQYRDYTDSETGGNQNEKIVFHTKDSLQSVLRFYEKKTGLKFSNSGGTYYIVMDEGTAVCGEFAERYKSGIRIREADEEPFYILTDEKNGTDFVPEDSIIEKKYRRQNKKTQREVEEQMRELQSRVMAGDRQAAMEMGRGGQRMQQEGYTSLSGLQDELEDAGYNIRIIIDFRLIKKTR